MVERTIQSGRIAPGLAVPLQEIRLCDVDMGTATQQLSISCMVTK